MPITSTIQQGTLSLAAVTPGNSAIGDAAAAGTSASVARADHKHGREASGTPGASAVGDTASAGTATTVALSDHRHSREAFGTPVNIDASLTSLSAGSLTTVARADHVHTVSNAMTFIGRVTLSVDASSLTAINIPQTFNNLMLLIETKTTWTGATDTAALRFNGLSTAVYGSYTSATAINQIDFATQGTLSATTAFSCGTMFIYNYTDTAKHKRVALNNAYYITAFNDGYNFWQQGTFLSNNAITSVQLLNTSGQSLKAGSRITIYGMP